MTSRDDSEFRFRSGRLSLDFVATVGDRAHTAFDRWRTEDDFARWCVEAGLLTRRISITRTQLVEARKLREAIYGILQCALHARTPQKSAIHILNSYAVHPGLIPRISKVGRPPTWDSPRPFEAVLSMIARDSIDLLVGSQLDRVRECADEHCSILFIDSSRPGKRRWCAMNGCGNKEKKASYRMRQQSLGGSADSATRRPRSR
jgi:predicted RNA-binding Zn ribbon-like protein